MHFKVYGNKTKLKKIEVRKKENTFFEVQKIASQIKDLEDVWLKNPKQINRTNI